jgi:hypothetical protein
MISAHLLPETFAAVAWSQNRLDLVGQPAYLVAEGGAWTIDDTPGAHVSRTVYERIRGATVDGARLVVAGARHEVVLVVALGREWIILRPAT